MQHPDLDIRPPRVPDPRFAGVTPQQVSDLVDSFYGDISRVTRLGPVFDGVIGDRWPAHLDRMKRFWRSVLLKTGEYSGRPVPAHMAIPGLREDDFRLWLNLFEQTARRIFGDATAPHVLETARRIARSLWFARFATPFDNPPDWLVESPGQGGGAAASTGKSA